MEEKIRVMMDLIHAQICEEPFNADAFLALSEQEQKDLAVLAKRHSVDQLLGDALCRDPRTSRLPVVQKLLQSTLLALNQVTKNEVERKKICQILEQEKIPYIQLKGARIRPYYPQPWMRTSCDIDILVREKQVEQAASLLCDRLNYRMEMKNFHDLSLYSPSGIHLELHFNILEESEKMNRMLSKVWQYSTPVAADRCEYIQSAEYFMFHLLSHMVHHMENGGCGIRPLIDLYLLRKKLPFDNRQVERFCDRVGILEFSRNIWKLVDVLFEHAEPTPELLRLERYILSGGVFGSAENQIVVDRRLRGGVWGYLRNRLFLSYDRIELKYPDIAGRRWLLPVYEVRHWFSAFHGKRALRVQRDVRLLKKTDEAKKSEIEQMLRENELL